MPRKKKKRRNIPAYLLLCALVICVSALMRSATPYVVPESAVLATAKPTATAEPVYTEPPEIAPTQAPTPSPTPEPVITYEPSVMLPLVEESSGIYGSVGMLAVEASTTPTAPPTAAPTATVTPTPVPTAVPTADPATWTNVIVMPTATPRVGPTPTYEYSTDDIRIEIVRHAEDKLVYFAAEIWLTDARQLKSAFSCDRFDSATESVSDIAERNGAVFAINGDFATFNNGGIIIRNGDVYRTNDSTRQLLVIDRNGDFIPYVDPPSDPDAAAAQFVEEGVLHTLVFGPVLVENGVAVPLPKNFFINTKGAHEPRTAIAQLGPLHYLFLVVDGRQDDYSKGVSLEQLQTMLLEYNVITAFNLDGGGSSTMTFHGNVLNRPANGGERRVPDILYFEP